MRHYYIRLVGGIIWLAAAVVQIFLAAIPFAILYGLLGAAFIHSAIKWKHNN